MIIHNNTKLLNDKTVHDLFNQLRGNSGIVSCPLGKIIYKKQANGDIEASSEYIKHRWTLD